MSESPVEVSGGGCCGVNGHLHDAATNELIGDVFADCYNSHYIKLNAGHFRLEREENGSAVTLVGLVDFEQYSWLAGCASARDFNEAEERLFEVCEINMLNEAGHACFSGLSLESLRVYPQLADRFLRDLRGRPIRWFFLKNRPTTDDLGFACCIGGRSYGSSKSVDLETIKALEIARRATFAQDIQQLAHQSASTKGDL